MWAGRHVFCSHTLDWILIHFVPRCTMPLPLAYCRCGATGRLHVHLLRHRPGLWRAGGYRWNRAWAGALRGGMRLERAVHDLCVCAGDGRLHTVVRRRAADTRGGARVELLHKGVGGSWIQTTGVAGAFAHAFAGGSPQRPGCVMVGCATLVHEPTYTRCGQRVPGSVKRWHSAFCDL